MKLSAICLAATCLVSSAFADADDFAVDVKPVFESNATWPEAPVAFTIENRGPDASGRLMVQAGFESTTYPLELPAGSKKRIVVYQSTSEYGMPPNYVVDTNQGRFEVPYIPKGNYLYGEASIIAFISDTSGDLGFLRQATESNEGRQNQTLFTDVYCRPENAPERPLGYRGIAAVMLGPGSERLSDESVRALQLYAMTGGTIILVGGASATVLEDPRWAHALPVSGFATRTVANSKILASIGGTAVSESVTVSAGSKRPNAKARMEGSIPMIAEQAWGLGRVVLFAFNPFEEPLARWDGRTRLLVLYGRRVESSRAEGFLAEFDPTSYTYENGYGGGRMYSGGRSYSMGVDTRQDPFSVELPKPSKVFWILAAFFIAVVPLNFLILRKLGRAELAWVTAPIISLVFAGVFLNQASELYAAKMSTATNGVLIAQQGMPEAMFIGSTQMFFPSGGSYDLKLEDVDQLGVGLDQYDYSGTSKRTRLDPIDVGTIKVPNLRAANLAFEELGYRQTVPTPKAFDVKTSDGLRGQLVVRVKNLTGKPLRNGALIARGFRLPLRDLEPGAEQRFEVPARAATGQSAFLEGLTLRQNSVAVVADFEGLKVGPQIGTQVALRSNVRIVCIYPVIAKGVAL